MEQLTIQQLLEATGGTLIGSSSPALTIHEVCSDSRKIKKGCLFLPLVGERFDGHDYISVALEYGAAGSLTAHDVDSVPEGKFMIRVEDTHAALLSLAGWYRNQFDIPVVAVTGSVGKTTTKDMVAAVLGEKYCVLKTDGNFNNDIGLPQTLLRLNHTHEIAVIEMGMNHFGEISLLTRLAHPDVALISNIGDAHMESMGSRDGVLKAKAEIFEGMTEQGVAILNGDDVQLRKLDGAIAQRIIWCGTEETNEWRVTDLEELWDDHIRCVIHTQNSSWTQIIPGLGAHMTYPSVMAAAVGRHFGLTDEQICRGILEFEPTKMRMAIIHRGNGITVLNDTYNANPQSMRAAVDVLSKQSGKRIAVLGDMLELGELGPALHESVGQFLGRSGIDCLVTVGKLGACIADGAERCGMTQVHRCNNQAQAQAVLTQLVDADCVVLFKASRGMHFENLVDFLVEVTQEYEK